MSYNSVLLYCRLWKLQLQLHLPELPQNPGNLFSTKGLCRRAERGEDIQVLPTQGLDYFLLLKPLVLFSMLDLAKFMMLIGLIDRPWPRGFSGDEGPVALPQFCLGTCREFLGESLPWETGLGLDVRRHTEPKPPALSLGTLLREAEHLLF